MADKGMEIARILSDSHKARTQEAKLRKAIAGAQATGDKQEIAGLWQALADHCADNRIFQRQAAHALSAIGDIAAARDYAQRSLDLDPNDYLARLLLGRLTLLGNDPRAAMAVLAPGFDHPDCSAELYHLTSRAALELDEADLAIEFAQKAWQRQPDRQAHAIHLLNLLGKNERYAEAEALVEILQEKADVAASALRSLSGHLMQAGDATSALRRINAALGRDSTNTDYKLHKAGILRRLQRFPEAENLLEQIVAQDPDHLRARRMLVALYAETNRHDAAIQTAAGLVAADPENTEYRKNLHALLTSQSNGVDRASTDEEPDVASLKTGISNRPARIPLSFGSAAQRKAQILAALVMRDIRTRYGRNRLSFVWALLEPLAHVAVLAVVFWITMRSDPPLGDNFLLFYFTGVQPFLLFSKIGGQGAAAVSGGRGILQLSAITPVDLILSKAAVELFITGCVVIAFGMGLFVMTGQGLPVRPGYLFPALGLSVCLGVGFAATNAMLREVSHAFALFNIALLRALYFTSGVFFLPSAMPENIRNTLLWNPLTHIGDMWRQAYYPLYDAPYTSPLYAGLFALGLLTFGICFAVLGTAKLRAIK
ncbi:ABC-type polysaccharide/polyol phosphate export permease [Yoonia tamlensis]|uniref:ABC-type polysaccharide/polyol phosphate export permease n=1 Tax=Yoonia tamlensis TaxID=390270 RepID=A0A1I6GLG9_9RHOB|nr:tetratricopeptide repeat protein [Yoonia tamlensis]SFR42907.1 ABC-type polysaccharide/polyol phosphate export permease [Yoonia tamlensis]